MVLPQERDPGPFGSWSPAATLASAIVALGLVIGWPAQEASAPAAAGVRPAAEPCTQGDEVSNFVCRNGWLAHLAHNHR
jgi:hypothetical protein